MRTARNKPISLGKADSASIDSDRKSDDNRSFTDQMRSFGCVSPRVNVCPVTNDVVCDQAFVRPIYVQAAVLKH
jgi:hypothetical protein